MANGQDFLSRGSLKIQVINIRNNFPIQNAKVSISSKGEPERVLEQLTTDSSGQTENISLPAPPEEYSLEPSIYQPYSEYNVLVEAEGFQPLNISGTEVLAGAQYTARRPHSYPRSHFIWKLSAKNCRSRSKTGR